MMVGTRYYSEADMLRMQRDAEERVREMRNRSRQASQRGGGSSFMPAFVNPNRNWNASPNTQRMRGNNNTGWQGGNRNNIREQQEETRETVIHDPVEQAPDINEPAYEHSEANEPSPPPFAPPEQEKTGTTVIDDIIGAIGIDSDTLLIVGLILILVNQKADITLIIALAYLLI